VADVLRARIDLISLETQRHREKLKKRLFTTENTESTEKNISFFSVFSVVK
jgi:hypothetical protein